MTSSVLMEGLARHTTSPTKINRFGERASNQKQLPQRPAGAYACVGPERAAFAPHACDTSRCTGFFRGLDRNGACFEVRYAYGVFVDLTFVYHVSNNCNTNLFSFVKSKEKKTAPASSPARGPEQVPLPATALSSVTDLTSRIVILFGNPSNFHPKQPKSPPPHHPQPRPRK